MRALFVGLIAIAVAGCATVRVSPLPPAGSKPTPTITTAGVNLLAADWTNTTATLKLANFIDSGTGATTAGTGDTGLQLPTGNARVAGAQTNPVAGQYRTAATLTYGATFAITEFGLFTATTAGTMWDHKVFAAINVVAGDSVAFSYVVTCNAGG